MIEFPRLLNRKAGILYKLFYFLVATLVIFLLAHHWSYDDPFITYRYANNILNGNGFVYNAGEHILSTTTPLFTILLAGTGWIWSDLPQLAVLIGSASLAVGGLILFRLAGEYKTPLIGWLCLVLYPTFPLVIRTLGSETPLYLALILGAILAYQRENYIVVGLLSGLAVVTRPDGLLVPALLAIHFLFYRLAHRPFPWKAVLLFALINISWFGFAWFYFGSPLPATLAAKQQQGMMAISQRFLPGFITIINGYAPYWGYWVAAVLMVIGMAFVAKQRRWLILLAWTAAYLAAYSILGVTRYFWYYAPLIPGFVVLVGAGFTALWNFHPRMDEKWQFIFRGAALVLILLLGLTQMLDLWRFRNVLDKRIAVYAEIGHWLDENTSPNASIGSLEVGAIGYYAQRKMIDFAGLIQPDVARQLTRDATYEDAALYAVSRYQPEYIVLIAGLFPELRQGPILRNCSSLESFENGSVAVDLFECRWR